MFRSLSRSELRKRGSFFEEICFPVVFTVSVKYFYSSHSVKILSNQNMIREILTLIVDDLPMQYYIFFGKDRKQFNFQPTLTHKSAPDFDVFVKEEELLIENNIDPSLARQAKEKVREILSNPVFDQL